MGISDDIRIVECREEVESQAMEIMFGGEGDDEYRFSDLMGRTLVGRSVLKS